MLDGSNNSLVYMGSVNLAPFNNSGPYAFSFPAALIGMIPGVRSAIQFCGTYVRTDGSRSTEAIAGNLTGAQGWNPFTQTAYADYTFDASADVAWPVWHPTLRLCQTTNLAVGQWTTVTNEVTHVSAENRVTVSPLSGNQFFRAEYP